MVSFVVFLLMALLASNTLRQDILFQTKDTVKLT